MRIRMFALFATVAAVIGIGVLPSLASAATTEGAASSSSTAAPVTLPASLAPQVKSDCPSGYICFWSGKTFGTSECHTSNCFSAFHGYETGYHNLESIDPQSMYNNASGHVAWFSQGLAVWGVEAGQTEQWSSPWTSGFEIK